MAHTEHSISRKCLAGRDRNWSLMMNPKLSTRLLILWDVARCQFLRPVLAGEIVSDHQLPHEAIRAFASLGANGKHPQNAERDLHRWLRALYGFKLEPYVLKMSLQVDNQKETMVPVRVLLLHGILDAVSTMESTAFFDSMFLGNMTDSSR